MPDFTYDRIKYNPWPAPGNLAESGGTNLGDWTGYYLKGGVRGLVDWGDFAADVAAAVESLGYIQADDVEPIVDAAGFIKLSDLPSQLSNPYGLDGPQGLGRFVDTDAAGKYGIGFATKQTSGASSSGPVTWFSIENPSAINQEQAFVIASFVATNGTAIPNTTDIEVGAFPITVSGGTDDLIYTMSDTNKVVNVYTDGISANSIVGFPATDRVAEFAAAGSSPVSWCLGVKLSAPLPSGCVMDVRCTLRQTPY